MATRKATAKTATTATPRPAPQGKGSATAPQTKASKPQATTAAKPAPLPRKCGATTQKAKPNRRMMRVIDTITKPEGKFNGAKRFDFYKTGMTLQACKEAEGLTHLDVLQYVEWEMMTLRDATDKEYDAAVAAWQKANAPAEEAKAS